MSAAAASVQPRPSIVGDLVYVSDHDLTTVISIRPSTIAFNSCFSMSCSSSTNKSANPPSVPSTALRVCTSIAVGLVWTYIKVFLDSRPNSQTDTARVRVACSSSTLLSLSGVIGLRTFYLYSLITILRITKL